MSSLREKRRLLALHKAGKPDEEFDMVNDDGEISDGDEDQRAREGLLLQQDQPQTPPKNPYARAVSKLMKPFKKDATASGTNISGPAQSLVRHDIVTTLTPELSALLGREGAYSFESCLPRTFFTNHCLMKQSSAMLGQSRDVRHKTSEPSKSS